jgi:hypothetical protein
MHGECCWCNMVFLRIHTFRLSLELRAGLRAGYCRKREDEINGPPAFVHQNVKLRTIKVSLIHENIFY